MSKQSLRSGPTRKIYIQTDTKFFMEKTTVSRNHSNKKYIKKDILPLIEKENLTDNINLSGPANNDSKYTINHIFNLYDPQDTISQSKEEIENIFLPITEK